MLDQASPSVVNSRGDPDPYPLSPHGSLGSPRQSPSRQKEPSHAQPTASLYTPRSPREDISRIREQVIMNRLDLRERRVDMRQQHVIVRNLEAQILRHWQTDLNLVDQDAIRRLHAELCTALEQLGPMEEDYDDKEDGLDTLEFDLEVKEKHFYRHHRRNASEGSFGSPSTRRTSMSTLSEETDRHLPERQDFLSPETQFYSRVGDAKIVRERLMELEAQRAHYLAIERDREALNIPLYQENSDFLSNYETEYAQHMEELEKIERDIQNLSVQAGLVSAHDSNNAVATPGGMEIANINPARGRRSPATEPGTSGWSYVLAEEPLRRKSEGDVWGIPLDPRSTRERINQWILERLEHSRLEKAMHMAILNDPKLDQDAWWALVLEFWQRDRAARSSQSSSRHVSGASTSTKPLIVRESPDVVPIKIPSVATTLQSTEKLSLRRENATGSASTPRQVANRSPARSRSDSLSASMSCGPDEASTRPPLLYARALYDHGIDGGTSLSFHRGDIIEVLTCQESGWWEGITGGVRGWFPSRYCATVAGPERTYKNTYKRSSKTGQALLAKISAWPQDIVSDHDIGSIDQLKYLDLAAKPSPAAQKAREKWDSILGC
ncbi:MAG: hypothetical protein Q9196_001864 [Gyalolechia fulgens]